MTKTATGMYLPIVFALTAMVLFPDCESKPTNSATDASTNSGSDAGDGATGGDASATDNSPPMTLSFKKDGTTVAVDFSASRVTADYQMTSAGWMLTLVANEIAGTQNRYLSLSVRETGGQMLTFPGTYDCSKIVDETTQAAAKVEYAEGSMERVWKSAVGMPCNITVSNLGEVGGRLKGTFRGTLKGTKGGDTTLEITEGVFDVRRQ